MADKATIVEEETVATQPATEELPAEKVPSDKKKTDKKKAHPNRLGVRDLITTGIFTALLLVLVYLIGMLGYIHPYMMLAYELIPLIAGIPMMLFYTKIEKFGMLTICSVLLAIFMFVTGMGIVAVVPTIVAGVIADLIARSGHYKSFKKTMISYGIFSLWLPCNYIQIVFMADSYRKRLLSSGFSAEYANQTFRVFNYKTIGILFVLAFGFGCLGALLGKAVMKKHFEKAGIV